MACKAWEISCALGSPNRGFQEGTRAAQGMKKEAGSRRGRTQKRFKVRKRCCFFPLINQITLAHACCSWLAGLKNNSESPMLLMTSASCVGFGHFSPVFLAEGRKLHEGMEERRKELSYCHQIFNPKPIHAGCWCIIKINNDTSKPPGWKTHRVLNHFLARAPYLPPGVQGPAMFLCWWVLIHALFNPTS